MNKVKRILSLLFALGMLTAMTVEGSSAAFVPTKPKTVEASETNVQTFENVGAHYYERLQGSTLPISPFNHDKHSDYNTPLDYDEKKTGANGGNHIVCLSVSGFGLEKIGYRHPSNSFDFTSYKVAAGVTLSFTFNPVTSCSLPEYEIADVRSSALDGFSVQGGIGKGAILLLKKRADASSWALADNVTRRNLTAGGSYSFTPLEEDIVKGTYFRFVAAYQYSYLDHTYETPFHVADIYHYGFVDVLERQTIFLGKGGTAIRFSSSTTPENTFTLSPRTYEASFVEGENVQINESNREDGKSFFEVTLWGRMIKASEDSSSLESGIPVYHFNAGDISTSGIEINFSTSTYYSRNSLDTFFSIEQTHALTKDDSTFPIPTLKKTYLSVQGLREPLENEESYSWTSLGKSGNSSTDFTLSPIYFSQYPLFRAAIVDHVSTVGGAKIHAEFYYFKVSVENVFRGRYSFGEGHDSEISSNLAACTLNDGSVVYSSFLMDAGDFGYRVEVAYNEQDYVQINESVKEFTEEGKYRFRVTNSFGEIQYTTIYLLDVKTDNAASAYLNHYSGYCGLLNEAKRVYAPDSPIPCYGQGTEFHIDASIFKPGLFGSITRIYSNGDSTKLQEFDNLRTPISGTFQDIGQYVVSFSIGDPSAAGDHISYTINFRIVEEKNHTPVVNYGRLRAGENFDSFIPKMYMVPYQSVGGGYFVFCFPYSEYGHQKAIDQAEKFEAMKIFDNEDGTYSYPGEYGTVYTSRFTLYQALSEAASTNIFEGFYSWDIGVEKGLIYEDITTVAITQNVYVVSDESIYRHFVGEPYVIDNFIFGQLRPYESEKVRMVHRQSGKTYDIPYGVLVKDILGEAGEYEVIESNWCGESHYDVIFLGSTNTVSFKLRFIDFGTYYEASIDSSNLDQDAIIGDIIADKFLFKGLDNQLDPYMTVTINRGNTHLGMWYLHELEDAILTRSGKYLLSIYNRLGKRFTLSLIQTASYGETGVFDISPSDPLSYQNPEVVL